MAAIETIKRSVMANKPRKHTRYDFKKGNKIIHSGITIDPKRREREHKKRFGGGHFVKVGPKVTEDSAREWEKTKKKTITPRRNK